VTVGGRSGVIGRAAHADRSAQKRRDRAATPHIGIQHHSVFVAVV
jgi:hypothetical protein